MRVFNNWLLQFVCVLAGLIVFSPVRTLVAHEVEAPKPAVNEFYYRVKWGYFDEFLTLFKKNHYPILAHLKEEGVILDMYAAFPASHLPEDKRWDRLTVLPIAPLIARAIHEVFDDGSVTSMFDGAA